MNCFPDGAGSCEFTSGSCDDGCQLGRYGDVCDKECSQTCVGNICIRSGSCDAVLGCVDGFYGFSCTDECNTTCNDGSCHRDEGDCEECRTKPAHLQTELCRTAGNYATVTRMKYVFTQT